MAASNPTQVISQVLNLPFPIPLAALATLPVLITTITSLWVSYNYAADLLVLNPLVNPRYDFIIIGGGSAGAVIANRLSENGTYQVLLLEAGGDPSALNSLPVVAMAQSNQRSNSWNYRSVPQRVSSFAQVDNTMIFPRAKILGGCSNINLMLYIRGNPNDFDNWANTTGDPQWNYENVLPFFKKSEDYKGRYPDPRFHGTGGPLTVSKQDYITPSTELFLNAGRELKFPVQDANAYQTQGFLAADVTIKNGRRDSTYWAFLDPIMDSRSNLKVYKYAHVTKIILDGSNKATGVQYIRHGRTMTAYANKEIILSAGAFNSPQILLLSGVGPADHLTSVGVTPKVNLPGVGSNFRDHPIIYLPFLLNQSVSFILERDISAYSSSQYAVGKGPLASNLLPGLAFVSTSFAAPNWPDMELHLAPIGVFQPLSQIFTSFFGLKEGITDKWLGPHAGKDSNIIGLQLGRPSSFGTIRLASKNPTDAPLIDPRLLEDTTDVDRFLEAIDFTIKLYEKTKTFQAVNATLFPNHFPGCEKYTMRSEEYWRCYIRTFTATLHHASGTCKMGRASDPMAVVDSNLKVRGVTGLRVADASIMPLPTNGNTNAPCIMIGEKVSQLLIDTWYQPPPKRPNLLASLFG